VPRPAPNTAFTARPPWFGADLQTLRNRLRRAPGPVRGAATERLAIATGDGDTLLARVHRPAGRRGPAAMLVHGLGGCEDSAYMLATAQHLVDRGHAVVALNLRGAGPSRPLCRGQYHAGRTDDLRLALAGLPGDLAAAGVVLVGFSLGGNAVLKLMAEEGASPGPVLGAVTVSAPVDLARAAVRLRAPRNAPYHAYLLNRMKAESLAGTDDPEQHRVIRGVRDIVGFDDRVVAPRSGFRGAWDYYMRASAGPLLGGIRRPTVAIHAIDDPWIPAASYDDPVWATNPALTLHLVAGGGHLGFHDRDGPPPWHDRRIAAVLAGFSP